MTTASDREMAILFLAGRVAHEDRAWIQTGSGAATERAKSLARMFADARHQERRKAIKAIDPAPGLSLQVESILRVAQAMIRRIE